MIALLTCLTSKTMDNNLTNTMKKIRLDLSKPEHHLAWNIYKKIEEGGDSVALGNRLMRGLGIDSHKNPPLLEVAGWSTKELERKCILMLHQLSIILGR